MQTSERKDDDVEESREANVEKSKKGKSAMRDYFDRVDSKYKHYSHPKYILVGVIVFCIIAFLVEIAIIGIP